MTRKKRDFTRIIIPDPMYNDEVLTKTVNVLMKNGKKSIAERALYTALETVKEKKEADPLEIFHKALRNIQPTVEVRSRRVGGATYQVPTEVRSKRAQALGIRWLILAANGRGERSLSERLAGEIMDAVDSRGNAVKKREDTHKMADANKAFAHFRW